MNKIKYWIPSVVIMILIFIASNDPASGEKSGLLTKLVWKVITYISGHVPTLSEESATGFIIRKTAHITEYFLLSLSYFYGFIKTLKNTLNFHKLYMISAVITLLYSISDEFHQSYISSRAGTYEDVLIDSIGICIGFLIMKRFF